MSYIALLADGSPSSSGVPWWVSGAWGLLGTAVGGAITYLTTKSVSTKAEENERERQRKEQITGIAIRFIQAVSRLAVTSMNIEETLAEYQEAIAKAVQDGNPAEAIAMLNSQGDFDPEVMKAAMVDVESQLTTATGLLGGLAGNQSSLGELQGLVAEMRLILPNEIIRIAELVSIVAYGIASAGSVLPLNVRLQLGGVITTSMNVFVNAVRHEVGLKHYDLEHIELHDAALRLEALAEEQKKAE